MIFPWNQGPSVLWQRQVGSVSQSLPVQRLSSCLVSSRLPVSNGKARPNNSRHLTRLSRRIRILAIFSTHPSTLSCTAPSNIRLLIMMVEATVASCASDATIIVPACNNATWLDILLAVVEYLIHHSRPHQIESSVSIIHLRSSLPRGKPLVTP